MRFIALISVGVLLGWMWEQIEKFLWHVFPQKPEMVTVGVKKLEDLENEWDAAQGKNK